MKKNFAIRDAVVFECSDKKFDLRGDCSLVSVEFYPSFSSSVEIKWKVEQSNHHIFMMFSSVEDFIVRGRDSEYPPESGTMLAIAGFSDGAPCRGGEQLYVEPTQEMNYMSFVMDDMSAIFVKAGSVIMELR